MKIRKEVKEVEPIRRDQLASFGERILADLLDLLLASLFFIPIGILFGLAKKSLELGLIAALISYTGYLVASTTIWGRTLGKRRFGLINMEIIDYDQSLGIFRLKISPLPEEIVPESFIEKYREEEKKYRKEQESRAKKNLPPLPPLPPPLPHLRSAILPVGNCVYTSDGVRWITKPPGKETLAFREIIKVVVMLIPFGFFVLLAAPLDSTKQTLYDRYFGLITVKENLIERRDPNGMANFF